MAFVDFEFEDIAVTAPNGCLLYVTGNLTLEYTTIGRMRHCSVSEWDISDRTISATAYDLDGNEIALTGHVNDWLGQQIYAASAGDMAEACDQDCANAYDNYMADECDRRRDERMGAW